MHRLFDPLVTRVVTPADCVDPSDPSDRPTRHRKPKPDMLLTLAAGHEVEDAGARRPLRPDELLMVGDQILNMEPRDEGDRLLGRSSLERGQRMDCVLVVRAVVVGRVGSARG